MVPVPQPVRQAAERRPAGLGLVLACAGAMIPVNLRAQVESRAGSPELHLVPLEGRPAIVPMQRARAHRWVTVSGLERLAIATAERPVEVLPVASTGSHTWKFAPDGKRICTLPLAADIRRAWAEEGLLEVVFEPGTAAARTVSLRARPEVLELSEDPVQLTVEQRRREWVPGSRRYLRLSIGDITGGQVLVEMVDAEGGVAVARRSMQQGDEARFTLGEQEYVLGLKRLVNFIIGDDYAEFTVGTKSDDTERRIRAVLDAMAASELTFLRNGVEYSGAQAAEFLRQKYALRRTPVRDFARFVEDVASRSSTTGRPYLVRSGEGRDTPLAAWLRTRDEALEKAREKAERSPKK